MTTARVGRRAFLGSVAAATLASITPRAARAEDVFTVGVLLPADAEKATDVSRGAALGLDDANALATLFGKRLRLETEADRPGGQAGRALARAGALAVVGGVGPGGGETLLQVAADGTPALNIGAPDDRLRNESCERRLFHVAPSVAMYVDALTQFLVDQRKLARWTVAGDGSPRGAEIEAVARRSLARRGAAVIGDAAAADIVLLAADDRGVDAAVARAIAEGRPPDRIAGIGEAGLRLPADRAAGLWAIGWHYELERFSARELNGRFRRRWSAPLTETSWAAWAALKLVGEAVVRAGASDGAALMAFMESAHPFDGHKGEALTFRKWDHQLRQPLYVAGPRKREDIAGQLGPFAVLADVGGKNLDAIGTAAADSRCRFTS
ncbi:MAG TPA: ABC transporter substrate-binding protein [Methylomirabilota bacterium]|nr:ABC transporter substrate-binding protein [Methylomirabilota bacterium]